MFGINEIITYYKPYDRLHTACIQNGHLEI